MLQLLHLPTFELKNSNIKKMSIHIDQQILIFNGVFLELVTELVQLWFQEFRAKNKELHFNPAVGFATNYCDHLWLYFNLQHNRIDYLSLIKHLPSLNCSNEQRAFIDNRLNQLSLHFKSTIPVRWTFCTDSYGDILATGLISA